MRYLVSGYVYPIDDSYQQKTLADFHTWITPLSGYQLDIETNVVEDLTEREIYAVQFGSMDGSIQWVLDVASFTKDALRYVIRVLSNKDQQKTAHNVLFEYSVIKQCWGIDIANLFDTFLMLKVVLNGKKVPDGTYKLSGAVLYYLGHEMSKEEQTSFTGAMLTKNQIIYAAEDVAHLGQLRAYFEHLEDYKYHEPVIKMENAVVRAFGDIVSYGFLFDQKKWRENIEWVRPQAEKAKNEVFDHMLNGLKANCIALGFVQEKDQVVIKWTSPKQKELVLTRIYPELTNVKLPTLKKFEQTLDDDNPIYPLINKDFDAVDSYMLEHHKELFTELGYFREKDEILINLDSPAQRLKLFQIVEPGLTSTGAEAVENCKHPMIKSYSNYVGKQKLMTSYGEKWFDFVSPDGRIRPRFIDQVLDTGRVSVQKPGMMTLPADEGYYLGNRYREPFLPTEGWKIVAGDYSSQELAIIAFLAKEDVWLDAIKHKKDLHSICAGLVFKDRWIDAGMDYEGTKPDDDNDAALKLRSFTKTISFGLAYGGGPGMLATRLGITMNEARKLISDYFSAFPKLKAYFNSRAAFATTHGYIDTAPPFRRRRYFPAWNLSFVDHKELSSIERQGKNTSIQGTGADGTKVAMILIKDHLEKNNLNDRVHILFMLHDAIITEARPDYIEQWETDLEKLMVKGHTYNIPGDLIGADVATTDTWTK